MTLVQSFTVLVVDDYPVDRRFVELIVKNFFPAKIISGLSGADGLREFKESKPELVITRLEMENSFAGLDLAKEIKRITPETKIILMSRKLPESIVGAKYVDRVLAGPVTLPFLVRAIELLGFLRF